MLEVSEVQAERLSNSAKVDGFANEGFERAIEAIKLLFSSSSETLAGVDSLGGGLFDLALQPCNFEVIWSSFMISAA